MPEEPTTGAATPRCGAGSGCGGIGCGATGGGAISGGAISGCGIGCACIGGGCIGGGCIGGGGSGVATSRALPTKIVCADPTSAGVATGAAASGVPQRPQNAKPGGLWNPQLEHVPAAGVGITGAPVGALPMVPPDPDAANCIGSPVSCGGPIGGGGIGPFVCGATGCGAVFCCGRDEAVGPDGCTGIAPVGADPIGIGAGGAGGCGAPPNDAG